MIRCHLYRKLSGLNLQDVSVEFGFGDYSSVSSIVIRMEKLKSNNKQLRKKIQNISAELDLEMSQLKT